jgi:L-aminopeptidase/D-esterase-like protein
MTALTSLAIDLPLTIGHAADERLKSGVTVVLPAEPAVASMHLAGGAPGTRETDLLQPENAVERIDAIVLSGGSAFGLAAADGAMHWLAGQGRGFRLADAVVPIVPAAILFDLANGGDKAAIPAPGGAVRRSPYFELGHAACAAASRTTPLGSVGAGTGATTANLKGGFGAAATILSQGARLMAFAAVNAAGRATIGDGPHFRAALFEQDGELGGLGWPAQLPADAAAPVTKRHARPLANTTLAVVATDLPLTKARAKRLAMAAHDGLALALFPAHTPADGDIVFALSTAPSAADAPEAGPATLSEACAAAAATLARAVARAVFEARPAEGDVLPAWRQRFGGLLDDSGPRR